MTQQKYITDDQLSNYSEESSRLAKIVGQLTGVEKMIQDERSDPEIIQQLRAATSALKALEVIYIKRHISSSIKATVGDSAPAALDRKLKELLALIRP